MDQSIQKRKVGFAAMDPERQRQVAALGGRVAHASGTAHRWNSEAARAAARKGAEIRSKKLLADTAQKT